MEVVGEFSASRIDQAQEVENEQEEVEEVYLPWKYSIKDQNIVQLKGNVIPRGLVPLERFYLKSILIFLFGHMRI